MRTLGWDDPRKPLLQLHPDPRWLAIGVLMAREVGDVTTEERLRAVAERDFEPRFFGENDDMFGWFFGNGEPWPRGQLASLMVLSELGEPGSWGRVFNEPNLHKFDEPTVVGVDYPLLGLASAWNDLSGGPLHLETYAATKAARGMATTFTVNQLPDPNAVRICCDGSDFTDFRVTGEDSVEISTTIDSRAFTVHTGYRGGATATGALSVGSTKTEYAPAACGGSCC
jgi:hypothetical protein